MVLCIVVVVGQFFVNKDFSFAGFMVAYVGAIAFVLLFIIYKIVKKTKLVKPEEADFSQGFAKKDN